MSAKDSKINPTLEKFINQLLKDTMNSPEATITDKVKVMDRALKLEALKAKLDETKFGSGFFDEEETPLD